jgi:cysteine synthase A
LRASVSSERSAQHLRRLIHRAFPVGPSSGLNDRAAQMAAERLGPDARIVTLFPDRMELYFSTELFAMVEPLKD